MGTTLQSDSGSVTRILLVEDNDINRQLMTDYLKYCGYEVFSVAKGESFAAAMTQFHPHLVLLDLKLPDIDGYTLLQQIQQTPDWSKIPVIVVSAFAFQADQQRALNLGACRYLVKPVKLPELIRAISEELSYLAV
ncbi:response regulator [Kovacikia minuta CCNUW1]|uniref:response regulator n=1 Tax=Kovacikia minuta TaxID=2931930 RepID=UPI001CCFD7C3|nr:response regulator [Kovacikia minuta]UBF28047.1 response regulator [Kovacikia minuta CCNUW1]